MNFFPNSVWPGDEQSCVHADSWLDSLIAEQYDKAIKHMKECISQYALAVENRQAFEEDFCGETDFLS